MERHPGSVHGAIALLLFGSGRYLAGIFASTKRKLKQPGKQTVDEGETKLNKNERTIKIQNHLAEKYFNIEKILLAAKACAIIETTKREDKLRKQGDVNEIGEHLECIKCGDILHIHAKNSSSSHESDYSLCAFATTPTAYEKQLRHLKMHTHSKVHEPVTQAKCMSTVEFSSATLATAS